MLRSLLVQTFTLFGGNAKSSRPVKLQGELANTLKLERAKIEEICKVSGVAGASVVVIHDGETVYQDNFGLRDVARDEPVTADTVFHIASLTKGFTGACIHRLREEGKLSIEDRIQKHLPEAKNRDPVVLNATVSDLLGHRTGLQKADAAWLGADGELLFSREQTVSVFNTLRPQASLRSRFFYNNIAYGVLGQIIQKITGQPYHVYLKEHILDPLGLTRTIVTQDDGLPADVSLAYSTFQNGELYNVPRPSISGSTALGSAGGLMSSANDLSKYCKALLSAWSNQAHTPKGTRPDERTAAAVFEDVSWIFAPLQIMETPAFREKSYASGWARSQLPGTVGTIGVNPGLVDMPVLANGIAPRLALWHQGSLVGATSFIMMLPETESAVLVLTNTMAPNDAADWIGQLLVESLLNSPIRNDYVQLASASAKEAVRKYAELGKKLEVGRTVSGPLRQLGDYVGSYVGLGNILRLEVVEVGGGLGMLVQGRESQLYSLKHHHDDTFSWFMSWDEQIRRARFISYSPALYMVHFKHTEGQGVASLNWAFDAAIPEGEEFSRV